MFSPITPFFMPINTPGSPLRRLPRHGSPCRIHAQAFWNLLIPNKPVNRSLQQGCIKQVRHDSLRSKRAMKSSIQTQEEEVHVQDAE